MSLELAKDGEEGAVLAHEAWVADARRVSDYVRWNGSMSAALEQQVVAIREAEGSLVGSRWGMLVGQRVGEWTEGRDMGAQLPRAVRLGAFVTIYVSCKSLSECPFPLSSTTSAFKITTQASQEKALKLDSLVLYDIG